MSSNNTQTTSATTSATSDTSKTNTTDAAKTTATTSASKTTVTTITPSADTSLTDDISNIFNAIFSSSNIMLMLWFLAAYFITYTVFGMFGPPLTGPEYVIKIVDVAILISIFAYLISYYYYNPDSGENIKKKTYNILNDNNTLIFSGLFLVFYALIMFIFRIPASGEGAPISLWLLSTFAAIVFTITAIVAFCKYVLGISILDTDTLKSVWEEKSSNNKDTSTKSSTSSGSNQKKSTSKSNEVFNVSNNLYTYDDARAVCTAFGARLATYDEIEDAYNKGGEWCSYGWSEGQMAYFPTQKATWEALQKNPRAKNNCGRPGVNGGYMENPYIKFGVNCFGQKPKPTDKDLQAMAANKLQPKTEEDELIDKKVQFWKENANKLLNLNSFNHNAWSQY